MTTDSPLLCFVIPMIAAAHSKDFPAEWNLLEETLEQALQIPNSVAVVVGKEILASKYDSDPRVTLLSCKAKLPKNVHLSYAPSAKDKTTKRTIGIKQRSAQYYMMLDADDFVPLSLGNYLLDMTPENGLYMPNVNLLTEDSCYYIENNWVLGPEQTTLCGSSIVYSAKCLQKLLATPNQVYVLSSHDKSPGYAEKYGMPLTRCPKLVPGYRKTGFNVSDFASYTDLVLQAGIDHGTKKPLKSLGNYYFR